MNRVTALLGLPLVLGSYGAAADTLPRVENLCGLSLTCNEDKGRGFMILPSARLGLVQIPFGGEEEGADNRFSKGLGFFKPSVGATFRYWLATGCVDAHLQFIYGEGATRADGRTTYLWGTTVGIGAPLSVLSLDIGFLNRRYKEDSSGVDSGFIVTLDLDLTAAGVALGTNKGQ
jgi:hypothetical protein